MPVKKYRTDKEVKTKKTIALVLFHCVLACAFTPLHYFRNVEPKKIEITCKPIETTIKLDEPPSKEEELKQMKAEYEKEIKEKAFLLLNDYVGKRGVDCYKVAIKFVKELKGIEDYELTKINEEEVECGDLIFYRNNGMGQTHWAVYLDENIALQGKGTMNGINVIGKVHYNNFSKPIFYRVERKK